MPRLEPFSAEETARYIAHRLKVAGYTGGELFTSGAMEIIKDRSKGVPRNINRLCFSALSLGCAMGRKRIDAEMMREVVADLDVESHEREVPKQLMLVPRVSSPAEIPDSPRHLLSRGIQQPAPTMGAGRHRRGRIDSNCCGIGLLFPWLDRSVLARENRGVCHDPRILRRPCKVLRRLPPLPARFLLRTRTTVDAPPVTTPPTCCTERRHSGPAGQRTQDRESRWCGQGRLCNRLRSAPWDRTTAKSSNRFNSSTRA